MLKKPLSIDEQIQKIKAHEIQIEDEDRAKEILSQVSYYRLSGYALQFRLGNNSHSIQEGISFEQICRIYCFDEELRNHLWKYVEKAEYHYKDLIGNEFALRKCQNDPHDQHYDASNYYDKAGITRTLLTFAKEKNYFHDSKIVKHHTERYGDKMPLWVMLELMTFSSVSMFYHAMYISDKKVIADKCGVSYATLENHLHCLSVLRNKCAHGARMYNTTINPPARFTKSFLQNNPTVRNNSVFAYILVLLKRLPSDDLREKFRRDLYRVLTKYKDDIDVNLLGFPENYRKLLILRVR